MDINKLKGQIINGFKFHRLIGKGSFGVVYQAQFIKTGHKYAIKIQQSRTLNPQLYFQYETYRYLNQAFKQKNIKNIPIPNIYGIFQVNRLIFLVMELLGKSLYEVFRQNSRQLSQLKVVQYSKQMFQIIQKLHLVDIIYRDIKPENFIFADQNQTQLKVVDFGLCKKISVLNQRSISKSSSSMIGTSRYASIYAHEGKAISKKDDIQSLLYVVIYLMRGNLPWQGIKGKNEKQKNNNVMKLKQQISNEDLSYNLPQQLKNLVSYIKSLQLYETIQYDYIQQCLNKCRDEILMSENINIQQQEWDIQKSLQIQRQQIKLLKASQKYLKLSEQKKQAKSQTQNKQKIKEQILRKKKKIQKNKKFIINDNQQNSSEDQKKQQKKQKAKQTNKQHKKFMDQ